MLSFTDPYHHIGATAVECALWLCVQARTAQVVAGKHHDEVSDQWTQFNSTGWSKPFVGMGPEFAAVGGVTFFATPFMPGVLSRYMRPMLTGNITKGHMRPTLTFSSDHIQALQDNIETPHAWIARGAESMINGLRMTGPETDYSGPRPQYTGAAGESQVLVVVRWFWLIYPATLVLLSTIYLIMEITQTIRSDARPWKADALVPLYTSLDLDHNVLSTAVSRLDRPSGLLDELGDLRLRLRLRLRLVVTADDGLQLSGKMANFDAEQNESVYGRVECRPSSDSVRC